VTYKNKKNIEIFIFIEKKFQIKYYKMKDLLILAMNVIHIFLFFIPVLIFWVPKNIMKPFAKYILLIFSLIPLHWVFLDNRCSFTIATQKLGNMKNTETNSAFSEKYLKWLYYPVMKIFGWEWNDSGLDKIITLHWIINILIVWFYCFFRIYN
tara:strand:+ start:2672 stop:3130 length:459 start_codon:yes stop_codon:yes gene_type:complete